MEAEPPSLDFARLFAGLPAPYLILLPDGPRFTILAASDEYLAATRRTREQIVGRGVFEAFPATGADHGAVRLRASLARVTDEAIEDRLPVLRYDVARDGGAAEERWWTPINSPVCGADGKVVYIVHRVEEATDVVQAVAAEAPSTEAALEHRVRRIQAQLLRQSEELRRSNRRLAESEHRYRAILANMPGVVFRGQATPPWLMSYASEGIERLTGYPASYFVEERHPFETIVHPEDLPRVVQTFAAQAAAGQPYRAEYRIQHRDGSLRWVEGRAQRVEGAPDQFEGTVFDIDSRRGAQEALALSERRFRSLVENIAGMVYRVQAGPPWHFVYVSEGVERLTGYPASYFVEEHHAWAEIMLPEDAQRVAAELAEQNKLGKPFRVEYRFRHRDGSVRWAEGRVRTAVDDPSLFEGTVFDIDERKRAEIALHESQEHFRYTLQSVPSVLWTAEPDGTLDFVSDAVREIMGLEPQDLIRSSWQSAIHPDEQAAVVARYLQSMRSGEPYANQTRIRDAGGDYRTFQVRAQPRRDEAGNILRWYGVSTNIDHLVQAQQQLRDSEALAQLTMQQVPTILWRLTPDLQVAFVSDGARQYLGRAPEDLLGDRWYALIHPEDFARATAAAAAAVAGGEPFDHRLRFLHGDGSYRWFRSGARPVRDASGAIQAWYGASTDIEEIVQAQTRAEEATRAKSAFLSTMSHEIRTPLNAVLGFAGLLADTELGTQQRDFVNSIRASGDHLLGVINDILDYSRLESGSFALDFVPCDIRTIVESALDIVASQAASKNLELIYDIAADVPTACLADQMRLRQVLVNLLGNAVKFTPAGEVVVTVASRPLGEDEHEFEFSVRDTGIGIPPERLDRLFRDFSQVDDSVTRRFGGSGLGLAISKRLVEAHGGTIRVQSRVGAGSDFRFRLPARAVPAPTGAAAVDLDHLRGRRVLLVDDNRSNLEILGLQLRAWGMDAVPLAEPERAAAVVGQWIERGNPFDLILLDHQMPGLDGLTLARQLHALAATPMVLLSSLGTTMDQVREARVEIRAALTKPIHRSALLETLAAVIAPGPRGSAATGAGGGLPASLPPLRLLLAEDNLVNRKVALLILRKLGCDNVDIAVDGLEAVEAVRTRPYDVVLMDVQMPNLDGLDATRRIVAEVPAERRPQIVAMTANALADDREACIAAGMNDHVAKPIDAAALAMALRAAAARRGMAVSTAAPERKLSAREEADARARRITDQVLAGGGEMGALMRTIDWSQTALGPVYTWPQSLRTSLSILLTQKYPIFLWWGRELIQFYNDAYRPILGRTKHPRALSQRGRECFGEIWDVLQPLVEAVFERGESTLVDHGLLCLDRNGLIEECYFSYAYSPIRDETGSVAGVFVACSENTAEVLANRRTSLLLELDDRQRRGRELQWQEVGKRLATAAHDLPFALVYRVDAQGGRAELLCASGLAAGSRAAPAVLAADDAVWPVFEALRAQRVRVHEPAEALPALAPWPEPPPRALLHPLGRWGVLVAGLSPRLLLDEPYRHFVFRVAQRLQGLHAGADS